MLADLIFKKTSQTMNIIDIAVYLTINCLQFIERNQFTINFFELKKKSQLFPAIYLIPDFFPDRPWQPCIRGS